MASASGMGVILWTTSFFTESKTRNSGPNELAVNKPRISGFTWKTEGPRFTSKESKEEP
jgi:hypothetical protein